MKVREKNLNLVNGTLGGFTIQHPTPNIQHPTSNVWRVVGAFAVMGVAVLLLGGCKGIATKDE